jgi:hypothetical protein
MIFNKKMFSVDPDPQITLFTSLDMWAQSLATKRLNRFKLNPVHRFLDAKSHRSPFLVEIPKPVSKWQLFKIVK